MARRYPSKRAKSTMPLRPRRSLDPLAAALLDVVVLGGLGASLLGRMARALGVTLGLGGGLVSAVGLRVGRVPLGGQRPRLGVELGGALAGGTSLGPALLDRGSGLQRHPLGEA